MDKAWNRSLFFRLNKYQKRILLPILISCIIAGLISLFCLAYFYFGGETQEILPFKIDWLFLHMIAPWMYLLFSFTIIFIVIWTYHISNKLVGPYDRIVRELDDVLAGKKATKIGTRKGDEMFEQLLKRINALIDKAQQR